MPASAEELRPAVQLGPLRLKNYIIFFLYAKPAFFRDGIKRGGSVHCSPFDIIVDILVLQIPNMGRQGCSMLQFSLFEALSV